MAKTQTAAGQALDLPYPLFCKLCARELEWLAWPTTHKLGSSDFCCASHHAAVQKFLSSLLSGMFRFGGSILFLN